MVISSLRMTQGRSGGCSSIADEHGFPQSAPHGGSPLVLEQKSPCALWRTPSPGVLKIPRRRERLREAAAWQSSPHASAAETGRGRQVEVVTQTENTVLCKPHGKRAEETVSETPNHACSGAGVQSDLLSQWSLFEQGTVCLINWLVKLCF